VRVLNRLVGREIEAHGMPETLASLQQRFDYAFLPSTAPWFFRPALAPRPAEPGQTVSAAGLKVELLAQDHSVMRTLGLRIGAFAYSTDLVRMPEETLARLHGLDTWVVACFQRAPHKVHAGLDQVLAWVQALKPRRTVLTHMGTDLDHGWLRANLPPGVEPGHDGMVLDVPVAA